MAEIEIRPGTETDCEAVLDMLMRLAAETGDAEKFACRLEDLRQYGFGDAARFDSLVATYRGQYRGLALYFPVFSTTRGRPGVYLQDLWVAPESRDSGLGTRMLGRVVARAARQWDAAYLDLMVHGHNVGADRFYRRHGFFERGEDRHLTLDDEAFQTLRRES